MGIFMMMSAFPSTQFTTPFDNSTIATLTASDFPNILNTTDPSNTVVGNLTTPTNATELYGDTGGGAGEIFGFIPDYFELPFAVLYYIIQFATGGWLWQGMALFGFPDYAVYAFQSLTGFWLVYTLAYYILGKG